MDALVKQQGMTLVEVMVAAAILALVMVASIIVASHTQRSALRLLDKTHAQWVANNINAEIRAGLHGKITETGGFQGQMKLGNASWYWSAKAKSLADEVIGLQIDVKPDQTSEPVVTVNTAVWRH